MQADTTAVGSRPTDLRSITTNNSPTVSPVRDERRRVHPNVADQDGHPGCGCGGGGRRAPDAVPGGTGRRLPAAVRRGVAAAVASRRTGSGGSGGGVVFHSREGHGLRQLVELLHGELRGGGGLKLEEAFADGGVAHLNRLPSRRTASNKNGASTHARTHATTRRKNEHRRTNTEERTAQNRRNELHSATISTFSTFFGQQGEHNRYVRSGLLFGGGKQVKYVDTFVVGLGHDTGRPLYENLGMVLWPSYGRTGKYTH